DETGDVADVDDLVLDLELVDEATELRDPLVERRLAALEPRGDRAAGTGLLALGAAARRLALARGDAASDAAALLAGPGCGLEVVQLHLAFSPRAGSPARAPSAVPAPVSSTETRKRTWRTMPRVASLSTTSTDDPMPCSPSALSVARLRAMWLIELLIWVTRSLSAMIRPPRPAGRGCGA